MPTFLYTAKDPKGKKFTSRIFAPTVASARYTLETQGFTELVFHTDTASERIDESLREGAGPVRDVLSPEQELAARRGSSLWSLLWQSISGLAVIWLPLAVWIGFILWQGRPFTVSDWIGLALGVVFIIFFFWLILPSVAFQKLLESGVWYRWGEMRAWVRLIRLMKSVLPVPIPQMELDFRLAYALAAEGKLEAGLALVERYENHACGKGVYWTRVSSLYEGAGRYDEMIRCRRQAVAHGDNGPEKLDLAFGLVRRGGRPDEASSLLAATDPDSSNELALIFLEDARGMIAVENGNWPLAEAHLRKTLSLAEPLKNNILTWAMMHDVKAYLILALAGQGKIAEAKPMLSSIRPLLEARKETALLERCKAALG